MQEKLTKIIAFLFACLFAIVPLAFYPWSSEVFEFNKIVTLYIFTTLIVAVWVIRMVYERKFVFQRTLLDIPILVFIATQALSTIFSMDPYTSFLGYYSRFHGGLVSTVVYSLLYWAWVTNIDTKWSTKILKVFVYSLIAVGIYAFFEHYGRSVSCIIIRWKLSEFNTNCWVQDVKTRVFATMGQPNWLAAILVAAAPMTIAFADLEKKNSKRVLWLAATTLFVTVILFTKSRSGIAALVLAFGVYAIIRLAGKNIKKLSTKETQRLLTNTFTAFLIFFLSVAIFGTPWTKPLKDYINQTPLQDAVPMGPALEVGGTESGVIRQIVWTGAINLWRKYPILGSGTETFAYAYFETRPTEHNLVSEWDFIYNKAHNEYLNFLATTGILGLLGYLILIGASLYQFYKPLPIFKKVKTPENSQVLIASYAAGYISILATNFFGFSVVAVALIFYLLAGFSFSETNAKVKYAKNTKASSLGLAVVSLVVILILFIIGRYWQADYLYARSRQYEQSGEYRKALEAAETSIKISPNQAIYHDHLARLYGSLAVYFSETGDKEATEKLTKLTLAESDKAFALSPRNLNIQRSRSNIFTDLGTIDKKYALEAIKSMEYSRSLAPTDARIYYKLALAYQRVGETQKALELLGQAIELKANYKDARIALATLVKDSPGGREIAERELMYVLEKIAPGDQEAINLLDTIKN